MTSTDTAASPVSVAEIDALGVRIDVRVPSETPVEVRARISDAWRDCRTDTPGEPARPLDLPASMFDDLDGGLSDLSTRVTLEALDALRGTRLLLHAAGVAADDGRVIALIGPSGRGKTTASRHLGAHFGYVSDETVAVADDLAVTAYRKPLSVITDGRAHKQQIAPSDFGLRALPAAPLRLSGLTLIDRRPEAATPGPIVVDTVDAICEMTPQISYLPELPSPLQYLARMLDTVGAPTRLVYRDAVDLPALVEEMFHTPAPPAPAWSVPPSSDRRGPWQAVPVDDAILVDGRACILLDGVVSALDDRGRLVWTMCRLGATPDEIVSSAIAEFGDPGDGLAAELIAGTIDDLRAHGLLTAA